MACSQCPLTLPYYNSAINQCQATDPTVNTTIVTCPTNYTYNSTTKQCVLTVTDSTLSQCPPSAPMWDTNKGACVTCQAGYTYNVGNKSCIPCADPANCGLVIVNKTCAYNYQWSNTTNSCQKCQLYQKYNNVTKICDNFCKPGEVYDSTFDICSGTVSNCPIGLVFDTNKMLCVCPQGANFKYNPDTDTCSSFCTATQQYNYLTQNC